MAADRLVCPRCRTTLSSAVVSTGSTILCPRCATDIAAPGPLATGGKVPDRVEEPQPRMRSNAALVVMLLAGMTVLVASVFGAVVLVALGWFTLNTAPPAGAPPDTKPVAADPGPQPLAGSAPSTEEREERRRASAESERRVIASLRVERPFSWRSLATFTNLNGVTGLAFSPDGTMLATACRYTIKIWDLRVGKEKLTLPKQSAGPAHLIAQTAGAQSLAPAGVPLGPIVQVLTASTVAEFEAFALRGTEIRALAFSPDGRVLASGSGDGTVSLWDVTTWQPKTTLRHESTVDAVAFSPDGHTLAVGGGGVEREGLWLWDVAGGVQKPSPRVPKGGVLALSWSADGRFFAAGGHGGTAVLWDARTGQNTNEFSLGAKHFVSHLALSPDGSRLAVSGKNSRERSVVKVFDTVTGAEVHSHEDATAHVEPLAFSPDGKMLMTADVSCKGWDPQTWELLCTLERPNEVRLWAMTFSSGGQMLATGGFFFNDEVKVWAVEDIPDTATLRAEAEARKVGFLDPKTMHLEVKKDATDDDLAEVKKFPVKRLDLWRMKNLTDAGLAHLAGLTELRQLDLHLSGQVTDAGLAHLARLPGLSSLNLAFVKVSDGGLKHLAGLTNLTDLDLSYTRVTGEGLAHLQGLTSLRRLNLSGTAVTDAGLTHLEGLKNLTEINLEGTKVTQEGVGRLRKALPELATVRTD